MKLMDYIVKYNCLKLSFSIDSLQLLKKPARVIYSLNGLYVHRSLKIPNLDRVLLKSQLALVFGVRDET